MALAAAKPQEYPKIDFSDVASRWEAVRAEVVAALATHGFFEAVYPSMSLSLRDSIMGQAMEELFSLPLDTKIKNTSNKPFHGYLGQIPYITYESLSVTDAETPQGVEAFTNLMWPEGNPGFCETVQSFTKLLAELDEMVRRMVLESLGVEKYFSDHVKSHKYLLRLSEYGGSPLTQQHTVEEEEEAAETKKRLGLVAHRDKNTLGIVCQNGVDGLEMETRDGRWVLVRPSPASFIVIAGDSLRAWTNGRVYSPLHRVVVADGDGEAAKRRYSAILFTIPLDESVICAAPELVDDEHPLLFKPYDYLSYVRFCMTPEGISARNQLDAFCSRMLLM